MPARWLRSRYGSGCACATPARASVHEAAIGVVDDHDFLGIENVVRYQQRAQAVVGHNTARVADNVRIPGGQPQRADGKPGVHASEDGKLGAPDAE